jgi:hypothetical protein
LPKLHHLENRKIREILKIPCYLAFLRDFSWFSSNYVKGLYEIPCSSENREFLARNRECSFATEYFTNQLPSDQDGCI